MTNAPPLAGWFRDDQALRIAYRLTGHADTLVRSWIELLPDGIPSHADAATTPPAWNRADGTGLCISCHRVEQPEGRAIVRWTAREISSQGASFQEASPQKTSFQKSGRLTRFSHQPHLLQPQLSSCTHCHSIDSEASVLTEYTSRDPHAFQSGFQPLRRAMCLPCHTKSAAGDRCTRCHNYHAATLP